MNLKQTELLEAYLKGELSGAEKAAFEAQLAQDPLFRSEMDLQSDIISSLKTYRKNQLKARLNNVDISPATFISASAIKFASGLIVAGFLGILGYIYWPDTADTTFNKIAASEVVKTEDKVSPQTIVQPSQSKEEPTETTQASKVEVTKPKTTFNKNTVAKKEKVENIIKPNVVDAFDEGLGIEKENKINNAEISTSLVPTKVSEIEINHEEEKAKELKYKYLNKKLYLFGDFSNSPYELLELNSFSGKSLFLFHSNKYYQLNENQKSVALLTPITDSLMIQELDTLRQNKPN